MQNPVEIIIQKYGYDYKSARNLVDDPYVKDLMNEIKELKKERTYNLRRIKRLETIVGELKKGK